MSRYALLNCPPGERLRQYRATRRDVTVDTAAELRAAFEELHLLQGRVAALGDADFYPLRREGTLEELADIGLSLQALLRRAWRRHMELRDALQPGSPAEFTTMWRVSWVLVCSCYVLVEHVNDMVQEERGYDPLITANDAKAGDFHYVRLVSDTRAQLSLSDLPLSLYSPRVLMAAAQLLSTSLDAYGWAPTGGRYLFALFCRYAMIVSEPAAFAKSKQAEDLGPWAALAGTGGTAGEEDEEEEEDPDPSGDDFGDARKTPPELLLMPAPLRTSFLDVGERYFFEHLWRDHALRAIPSTAPPPTLAALEGLDEDGVKRLKLLLLAGQLKARAQWRLEKGLPALREIMAAMFKSPEYRDLLVGDVQNLYPERLLRPGERRQMLFEYKDEVDSADAHEVLYRLRYAAYHRMTTTLHFDRPMEHIDAYIDREAAVARALLDTPDAEVSAADEDGYLLYAAPRGPRAPNEVDTERLMLLLLERVIDRTVETATRGDHPAVFAQTAYVDDRSLDGPRGRPPFDAETWHVHPR